MALVKTSELPGKGNLRQVNGDAAVASPPPHTGGSSQRRVLERVRARQRKAAERLGAATEELASGVTEASSAAEELRRSMEQIATGADFAYPATVGRRPPGITAANRYLTQVIAAAAVDRVVNLAFSRVQQLLDPPSSLLRPGLVARVRRAAKRVPTAA